MKLEFKLPIGLVCLALILCAGRVAAPAGAISSSPLQLRSKATVKNSPLTLGDVVRNQLPPELEGVVLGELPKPGRGKFVNRAEIMMALNRAGKSIPDFEGDVIQTNVDRPTRKVKRDELIEPLKEVLKTRLGNPDEGELELLRVPGSVKILPGEFKLELDRSNPYQELHTTDQHTVRVRQSGEVVREFQVRARLINIREVPVTTSRLKAGVKLTRENLEVKKTEVQNFRGDLITELEEVAGFKTSQPVPEGEPLRTTDLERPLMVERNDKVTIRYQVNGVVITAEGIAEKGGRKGDEIVVKNNSSGEQIYVEVIGKREVKVKNVRSDR